MLKNWLAPYAGNILNSLTAHPFATVSTAAFYILMIAYCVPKWRRLASPLFSHPIPPHQQYLLGFDSLRGLAAAFVAMAHFWWASYPVFASTQLQAAFIQYGAKGVPVFAVLSGFLIYRSALGAVGSIEKMRDFVIRRFFRIYPVYLLGVFLCLATGQYIDRGAASALSMFMSDVFMLNVFSWPDGYANPPTWSVYVEVAFYAFLPIMVLALPRRWILPVVAIGLVAMLMGDSTSRVFSLWKYFLCGIIASEMSRYGTGRVAPVLFSAGLALLIIDFQGPRFDWAYKIGIGFLHSDGQSVGLGLAVGLILAALPGLPRIGELLNVAPLRLLGVISYSVYIIQFFYIKANFPVIAIFSQAGTQSMYEHMKTLPTYGALYLPLVFFPGVLFWGCVSFLLIERPGIQLGRYLIERSRRARVTEVSL